MSTTMLRPRANYSSGMRAALTPVPLDQIEAARDRLRGIAVRTPLVRFGLPGDAPGILLKLENLQPIGSFKLRGAANAMALADRGALAHGVSDDLATILQGGVPAR